MKNNNCEMFKKKKEDEQNIMGKSTTTIMGEQKQQEGHKLKNNSNVKSHYVIGPRVKEQQRIQTKEVQAPLKTS